MRYKIGNIVKVLGSIWTWIVFICAIALLGIRFIPPMFGYEPIWCMSNSMAPTFHEGALCFVDTNYDADDVEVGDIIAYSLSNGAMVTHRVNAITNDGIITKGDANDTEDFAPISNEQIIGENVLQIEYMGNLFKDFPNKLLISCVAFAISAMLLFDVLSGVLLNEDGDEKNDKAPNQQDTNKMVDCGNDDSDRSNGGVD